MLMRAATVVQVLQDLFYVLLQLFVVSAIILSFKFYCKFYCVFYFTCDRSFNGVCWYSAGTKTRTDVDDQADSGVESPGPRSTSSSEPPPPPPTVDGPTTTSNRAPDTPPDCPVKYVLYSVHFASFSFCPALDFFLKVKNR